MATKKIALAYCIDNLPVAESLYKALSQTSYSVAHYYCKKNTDDATLAEQLRDFDGTILLLISDNFLRSEHCMNRALQLVQQKSGSILPVVIDGRSKDETTGEWVNTPTKFERIGDIIPYINYWQNKYLDLRSQKRKFESENEADKRDELNESLRVLRQVSSEASEFLRVLRNMRYYQFSDFIENHFQAFFEFVGDSAEWSTFKINVPNLNLEPGNEAVAEVEIPIETPVEESNNSEFFQPETTTSEEGEEVAPVVELEVPVETPVPTEEEAEHAEELSGAELAENLEDLGVVIAEHTELAIEEEPLVIPALEAEVESSEVPVEPNAEAEPETTVEAEIEPESETTAEHAESHTDVPVESADAHPVHEVEPVSDTTEEEDNEDEEDDDDDDEDEAINDRVLDLIREARGLVASGQVEAGINFMKQAIKTYPGSAELHYFSGLILAQNTRDLSGALEQLALATEIDPDHEAAFFLLGELAEHQGNFYEARKNYERLIDVNDEFPDVYYRLGSVLQAGFPEDVEYAAKCFKKAAKRNPENADAHYQYASLLADVLGKTAKAEEFFLKTLAIQPKHPFANYDLALIYHTAGHAATALEYYEAAIANNPELQTPENEIAFRGLKTEPVPADPLAEPVQGEFIAEEEPAGEVELEETTTDVATTIAEVATTGISPLLSIEHDTIEALKQNILRLEELLRAKAAQIEEPVAEPEPVVEEPVEKEPAKTAFITGATSGIGLATARTFAQAGWRLIITGRRAERLEAVTQELSEAGAEVLPLVFDVRSYDSVAEAVQSLPEEWRNIDLLINNAGKAKGLSEIQEGSLEHWEEMIDTNLKGLLYLTRCISPLMVSQHRGHIINIGSIAGKEPYPMGNVYCASKAAVDMLTRTMRLDLHKYNIRVSQIAPGHVEETEFALVRFDGDADRAKIYNDFQPLTSQDVSNTIYYIATQPSHVNIQDVVIYGTQQASATVIDRSGRV